MRIRPIFSWAQNPEGEMVHIDNVPNGLKCNCICPHCKEQLLARHGNIREHGFAHCSQVRRANLEICYMVILYKLAEQIIFSKKQIHAPTYYNIYKESDITFTKVQIDSHYERIDKQPDVIALTNDNQQYLIEFIFQHKIQHKKDIDYTNLNCLEVDLSNQTLESLEDFLLHSNTDRRWINNNIYFNNIESIYQQANKSVKVVSETDCKQCILKDTCCAITNRTIQREPLRIRNNNQIYRICKRDIFQSELELRQRELKPKENFRDRQDCNIKQGNVAKNNFIQPSISIDDVNLQEKTCFNCKNNLKWANKDGYATCGIYESLRISQQISPKYAENCDGYSK